MCVFLENCHSTSISNHHVYMFFFHICQNSSQSWSSLIIGRTFKWIRVNWGCQYYSHTKPNLGDKHKFTSYAFDMHAQSFTKQRSWKKIDKNCQIFGSTKQQLPSNHQIACERALRTTKKKRRGKQKANGQTKGVKFSGWRKGQKNIWIVYD